MPKINPPAILQNPGPVITGVLVGGAVLGPVGAVVGGAAGAAEATQEVAHEQAIDEYITKLNVAIIDVRAALPNFEALAPIWTSINVDMFHAAYKLKYGAACPPPEILGPMIAIDVESRRKSLPAAAYEKELTDIHTASVEASVVQLAHERDNVEKQDKPAGDDILDKFFSDLANATLHWLETRFDSNFEGAANESGFGAKLLRGGLGISWEDIKSRGLLGGDNSYLRKIIPTWSDGGGFFGGENSFFRKPFG